MSPLDHQPGTGQSLPRLPNGSPEATRAEILPFTALRGLAAWWVAIYHFRDTIPIGGLFEHLIVNGPLAVDLFFIMSGFVLALSYGPAFRTQPTTRSYARFMTLRLGRIYPLHIVVLILFLSVPISLAITGRPPVENQFQPGPYLANILLVQNWLPGTPLDWNVPAWSISTEFMFYLLFPVFALAMAKLERAATACLAAAALLVFIATIYGPQSYTLDFGPLRCLPECLLGMLLFRITTAIRLAGSASHLLFAAFLLLCSANAAHLASDQATMPLAFALLLWSLLNPHFWLSRLLSHRVLLWLGHVSFSTYLIHVFVKYWMKFLLVGNIADPAVFALYILTVALASWALHHTVELPGREAGRSLAKRMVQPKSVPVMTTARHPSRTTETGP